MRTGPGHRRAQPIGYADLTLYAPGPGHRRAEHGNGRFEFVTSLREADRAVTAAAAPVFLHQSAQAVAYPNPMCTGARSPAC